MSLLLALILLLLGFFSFATTSESVSESSARPDTAPAPQFVADEPIADLTIRNWVCPADFTGANYVIECVEPVAGLDFEVTSLDQDASGAAVSIIAPTGDNGAVTFANLPAATYDVTGGPPGEFVQNAITCYVTDLERLALPFLPRHNRAIGVTLVDTDITCDWYSIPENLRGDA